MDKISTSQNRSGSIFTVRVRGKRPQFAYFLCARLLPRRLLGSCNATILTILWLLVTRVRVALLLLVASDTTKMNG